MNPAPSTPESRCSLVLLRQTRPFCSLAPPSWAACPPLRSQPPGSGWGKGGRPGPFPPCPAPCGTPRATALQNLQDMKDGPGCCCGNHSSLIDGLRTHLLQPVESNLRVLLPSGCSAERRLCPQALPGSGWGPGRRRAGGRSASLLFAPRLPGLLSHTRSLVAGRTPAGRPGCARRPGVRL